MLPLFYGVAGIQWEEDKVENFNNHHDQSLRLLS